MGLAGTTVDTSCWSGDGDFTQKLVEALERRPEVAWLRVEDAPASRAEVGYNFLCNEVYVAFATRQREERYRWLGLIPRTRRVPEPLLTLSGLEAVLASTADLGPPDYADEGMLQYLRTERIVAPYQTRGVKVVELVRIYAVGSSLRRTDGDGRD